MAILKKIKAATLMETLVATVLIVVVFVMASLILNNTFSNLIRSKKHQVHNYIYELEYQYLNNKMSLPYSTEYNKWDISIYSDANISGEIKIIAINKDTKKQIEKTIYDY
ncbi:hypothetical protein [Winogradskyella haliclonae]|uniref:Type II secretion system protein n=1 Tax=Winogradskyella haliclonae TaxID=2048558 RepID=A0ABQ2C0J8_9FLAO|nr:hypothetical protein [Winogradskyella haliclonae]GGI57736.1 hypothetical protein GCM10011444_20450 [Winogradskyella haliclonae]